MRHRYPTSNRGRASGSTDTRLSKTGYCTTHHQSFNTHMRAGCRIVLTGGCPICCQERRRVAEAAEAARGQ